VVHMLHQTLVGSPAMHMLDGLSSGAESSSAAAGSRCGLESRPSSHKSARLFRTLKRLMPAVSSRSKSRGSSRQHSGLGAELSIKEEELMATMLPEFPMYVMEAAVLLNLKKLEAFQTLLQKGLIRVCDPESDLFVLFGSHQWTADTEPDHTGAQLRTLQGALRRMVAGDLGVVGENFGAQAGGAGQAKKLSSRDLQQKMSSAVVWLDYSSIPQPSFENNAAKYDEVKADMLKAVRSIPAYVMQASLMLVICPSVVHREQNTTLGLGTWLDRAWCNLEVRREKEACDRLAAC
jgi:hypothetical protein